MKKKNNFILVISVLIAVCVIVLITNVLLDTTGNINQGKFRVNDVVIKSVVSVEEINENTEQNNGFESMKLNLSQNNSIVMLVTKDESIESMYIDKISLKNPEMLGQLTMTEGDLEKFTNIDVASEKVVIYPKEQDDQYLVQINIDNKDFLKDAKIPSGVSSLTYDGSMLRVLDIPVSKLKFDLKFNLNIIENTGKVNVCKIKVTLPEEELMENGISIKREDLSNYKFSIKNSFSFFD